MRKNITTLSAALLIASGSMMAQTKNVIIYIGDGFGLAAKTATRMAMGQGTDGKRFSTDSEFQVLALDKLKYNATVTTHSMNSWITDSAPGAAVYASGKNGKVDNEVLSIDVTTGASIETILEAAKKEGYAVGLVTTTRVTHATPAAFASHIWNRDLEDYISAQFIASTQADYEAIFNSSPTVSYKYNATRDWKLPESKVGVELDVILGGGARHFLPKNVVSPNSIVKDKTGTPIVNAANATTVDFGKGKRADDVDLIEYAKSSKAYTYVNSRDALVNIDLDQFTSSNSKKLLGLFNASHSSYDQDRQLYYKWEPSLSDMTKVAIEVLKRKSTKGYFLLVEGGRIDHLAHANTGGITVVTGTPNQYTISADLETYEGKPGVPEGEGTYAANPTTGKTANVYGSDYVIKEVLAFDYAVAEGRKTLTQANAKSLIFSTSDHECGGMALVGLHDEADAQKNGTKIRTYAGQITKSVVAEAGYANPTNLVRGDGGKNGWFPEYTMTTSALDGKMYPEKTSATGKRIVIAYGSNPVTNGNGTKAGGSIGNHTPQDIWVGAEDNTDTHAKQLSGKGLLDNTSLTPIMADFLGLTGFITNVNAPAKRTAAEASANVYPNPFTNSFNIQFDLDHTSQVSVELINELGVKIATIADNKTFSAGSHTLTYDATNIEKQSVYYTLIKVNGGLISKTVVKL